MTQLFETSAVAPEDPDETSDRVGSDEEGHEYLIDLYFYSDEENETKANMADRFPSLDDFAAGMTPLAAHCPFEDWAEPREMNYEC